MLGIEPIGPLRFNVDLSYRDSGGVDSLRRVTVQQLDLNPPASISGVCHLRRARRSFRIDRIVQLVCPVTGEVPDRLTSWFKERASGPQDGTLPGPREPIRKVSQVVFKGGRAQNWAFGVPAAFKIALDVSLSRRFLTERAPMTKQLRAQGTSVRPAKLLSLEAERALLMNRLLDAGWPVTRIDIAIEEGQAPKPAVWVEMQGTTPNYDFSAGDIFYCPPDPGSTWGEHLKSLQYIIQVQSEEFERINIEVRRYEQGEWISTATCEISQAELVSVLRFGVDLSSEVPLRRDSFRTRT